MVMSPESRMTRLASSYSCEMYRPSHESGIIDPKKVFGGGEGRRFFNVPRG